MTVFIMQLFESIVFHPIETLFEIYNEFYMRKEIQAFVSEHTIQILFRIFTCGAIVGSILKSTVSTPVFTLSR